METGSLQSQSPCVLFEVCVCVCVFTCIKNAAREQLNHHVLRLKSVMYSIPQRCIQYSAPLNPVLPIPGSANVAWWAGKCNHCDHRIEHMNRSTPWALRYHMWLICSAANYRKPQPKRSASSGQYTHQSAWADLLRLLRFNAGPQFSSLTNQSRKS